MTADRTIDTIDMIVGGDSSYGEQAQSDGSGLASPHTVSSNIRSKIHPRDPLNLDGPSQIRPRSDINTEPKPVRGARSSNYQEGDALLESMVDAITFPTISRPADSPTKDAHVPYRLPIKLLSLNISQYVRVKDRLVPSLGAPSGLKAHLRMMFLAMLVCTTSAMTCLEQSVVAGQGLSGAAAGISGYALLGYREDPRVGAVLYSWVFGVWGLALALFLLSQTYWIVPEKRGWYITASLMLSAVSIGILAPSAGSIPDGISTYGPLFAVMSAIFTYLLFEKRRPQPEPNRQDIEARVNTGEGISLPELHGGANAPVGGRTYSQDQAERRSSNAIADQENRDAPGRVAPNTMHEDHTAPPTYAQVIDPLTTAFPRRGFASGSRHVEQPINAANTAESDPFHLTEDEDLRSLAESSEGQLPTH